MFLPASIAGIPAAVHRRSINPLSNQGLSWSYPTPIGDYLLDSSYLASSVFEPTALTLPATGNDAIVNVSTSTASGIICHDFEYHGTVATIVLSAVIGLVAIVTIAGNTLVIVAFGTDRKLRSFGNYFILNLAISDLIVGLLICVYAPYLMRGCWQLTRFGCLTFLVLDYIVPLSSAWNMALISLDRYWSVAHPIQYRLKMSSRLAVLLMSVPWLAGTVWYAPTMLLWAPLSGKSVVPEGKCFVEFFDRASYLIASSFVEFVLPFVTVATINILIYLNIRRRSRGLMTATPTVPLAAATTANATAATHANTNASLPVIGACSRESTSPSSAVVCSSEDQQRRAKARRMLSRDKKSARSLAILIVIFLVTWAPFEICSFVNPICSFCIEEATFEVVFWLLWLNSTINPILYPFLQQRFRVTFTRLLCCCRSTSPCNASDGFGNYRSRPDGTTNLGGFLTRTGNSTAHQQQLRQQRVPLNTVGDEPDDRCAIADGRC